MYRPTVSALHLETDRIWISGLTAGLLTDHPVEGNALVVLE